MGQRRPGFARAGFRRVASSTTSSGSISVANFAAVATLPSSSYDDGQPLWVKSARAQFLLMPSNGAAARTNYRIAALGKLGYQWVRVAMRNGIYEVQPGWVIDPKNITGLASDDNSGVDATAPLLTFQEHAWRLAGAELAQNTTTTYLSDQQPGDAPTYTFLCQAGIQHAFQGSATVLHTGTVTSYTPMTFGAITAADDAQLVDAAVAGGSWTAAGALGQGVRVRRTNGVNITCWVVSDLGGTTGRTSQPFNSASVNTRPAFAPGDTYVIEQLPKVTSMRFLDLAGVGTKFIDTWWASPQRQTGGVFAVNCYFSTLSTNSFYPGQFTTQGCCFDTGGTTFTALAWTCTCPTFKGTGATLYTWVQGVTNFEGNIATYQGARCQFSSGFASCTQFNAYDVTNKFCNGDTGARVHFVGGGIGGKGCTSKLVAMHQGSQLLSGAQGFASGAFFNSLTTTDNNPIEADATSGSAAIPLTPSFNMVATTS